MKYLLLNTTTRYIFRLQKFCLKEAFVLVVVKEAFCFQWSNFKYMFWNKKNSIPQGEFQRIPDLSEIAPMFNKLELQAKLIVSELFLLIPNFFEALLVLLSLWETTWQKFWKCPKHCTFFPAQSEFSVKHLKEVTSKSLFLV